MTRKKFAKSVALIFTWGIFLSLAITNWSDMTSVRWQDLWETFKLSGIGDIIRWNAGYIVLVGLFLLFMVICIGHGRKHRSLKRKSFSDMWQKTTEYHDPAYSAQPGNIHYQSPFDNE